MGKAWLSSYIGRLRNLACLACPLPLGIPLWFLLMWRTSNRGSNVFQVWTQVESQLLRLLPAVHAHGRELTCDHPRLCAGWRTFHLGASVAVFASVVGARSCSAASCSAGAVSRTQKRVNIAQWRCRLLSVTIELLWGPGDERWWAVGDERWVAGRRTLRPLKSYAGARKRMPVVSPCAIGTVCLPQ